MRNSGVAIMGTAVAEGENRAILAVEEALNSPLLNDNDIKGAKNILLNITSGKIEVTLDEISEIQDYIQSKAGSDTNIIWGNCYNEALGDKLSVTVIATGFESIDPIRQVKKTVTPLTTEKNTGTVHTEIKSDVHQASQQPTSASVTSHKTQVQPELELPLTIQTKSVQDVELIQHNDVELSTNITELTEESHHIHAEAGTQIKFTTSTTPSNTIPINEDASQAQNLSRAKNDRLKSMNYNGYRSNSVYDKENTPAYLRKNIKLNEPPHSSDSSMSQMYIDMPDANGRGSVEIKKNNFLHGRDKVD
jgi:cell division protein FtsZ